MWPHDGDPIVIDGYAEMPGRGAPRQRFGSGGERVYMEYGGGMETIVGYGSVATPGAFAGLGLAHERYGRIPWAEVLRPAIDAADGGFPLSQPAAEYLTYAHDVIFGWDPQSSAAVHHPDGTPLGQGETLRLPELAETLRAIAHEGPGHLYEGELARALVEASEANGGILTAEDLEAYRAIERSPIVLDVGAWSVAANPPPAVGGACMAAMVLLLEDAEVEAWGPEELRLLAAIQHAVLTYRRDRLDGASDRAAAVRHLLDRAAVGDLRSLLASPSTSHTSAVDDDGNACAITVSAGYGSGAMVPGTGFWLNNSLGEIELNPEGFHALEPGTRLVSNMAPTVARRDDGSVLAIGSPGADRITTALSQVLYATFALGRPLEDAVAAPRLHVEVFEGEPTVALEPGLSVETFGGFATRRFETRSMYFGGVQAAAYYRGDDLLAVAADPRRDGGTAIGGTRASPAQ